MYLKLTNQTELHDVHITLFISEDAHRYSNVSLRQVHAVQLHFDIAFFRRHLPLYKYDLAGNSYQLSLGGFVRMAFFQVQCNAFSACVLSLCSIEETSFYKLCIGAFSVTQNAVPYNEWSSCN